LHIWFQLNELLLFGSQCGHFRIPDQLLYTPLQVPRVITHTANWLTQHLPVEIAGWLMQKYDLPAGCWVLFLSPDPQLGAALITRAPMPANVIYAQTTQGHAAPNRAELEKDALQVVTRALRDSDTLPTPDYGQKPNASGCLTVFRKCWGPPLFFSSWFGF
jgi:hypothetical protein